jgi:hypothetical protein
VSGADNQQERPSIEAIPVSLGSFLSGFALGEASFMLVVRSRRSSGGRWRISAAFNVSQHDRAPLEVFKETLGCGSLRRAGNGGWYWEVNRLSEIQARIIPFFERFPVVGEKANDFNRFKEAVSLLSSRPLSESHYRRILLLRRRDESRRQAAPLDGRNPQRLYAELPASRRGDEIVRSHGRP